MHRRRALLAVLCLLTLAGTVAIVHAHPPPAAVCDPCRSDSHGTFPVEDIEHSTATIQVQPNGTAVWTVRNRLGDGEAAERLRENESRVDAVAREAVTGRYAHPRADVLNASIDGDTVTMRYVTPDFATRTRDAFRVEYLRSGYQRSAPSSLGADRVTIVPPDGYRATGGLPGASTENGRLVMHSFDARAIGPFVVFVDEGSIAVPQAAAAIGSVLLPRIAINTLWLLLVPGVVLAFPLMIQVALWRERDPVPSQLGAVGAGTVAGGGISLLAPVVFAPGPATLVLVPVGIGFLLCGSAIGYATDRRIGRRPLVVLAVPAGVLALGPGILLTGSGTLLTSSTDGLYVLGVLLVCVLAVVIALLTVPWFLFAERVVPGEDW